MFESAGQRSRIGVAHLVIGVLTFAAFAALAQFRPVAPPPLPPVAPPFSWDAVGRVLHRDAAVVACFDQRERSEGDDPEQIVTVVFGGDVPPMGWDAHAVSVEAGPQDGLERCLMKTLRRVDVLEPGATEPLGWRVKLATWDRHPVLPAAEGHP